MLTLGPPSISVTLGNLAAIRTASPRVCRCQNGRLQGARGAGHWALGAHTDPDQGVPGELFRALSRKGRLGRKTRGCGIVFVRNAVSFSVNDVAFPPPFLSHPHRPALSINAQRLSTPASWLPWGPKRSRRLPHTSWRRSQPFPSRLCRSSGYRHLCTVPFLALTYLWTRNEPLCRMTYRYGAKRVCGPNALCLQAVISYTLNVVVIVIHRWCLRGRFCKLRCSLEFHALPVSGKCTI